MGLVIYTYYMARFKQDFRVDCILVQASRGNMMAYASRYLKMPAGEIAARISWLERQPDKYKKRIEAQVKLMDLKVKGNMYA